MVGAMHRHAGVMEQACGRDHDLGVGDAHPVRRHHRRLDILLAQEPEQPQREVEHDPDVDPGMVGHPEAVGHRLRGVPPRLELQVVVGGLEEAGELPVALRGSPNAHLRNGLRRRPVEELGLGRLCFVGLDGTLPRIILDGPGA